MEAFDQYLAAGIGFRIEQLMGMTIAPQKALQPQHIAVLGATHDDRTTHSALEDADATQNEPTVSVRI